MAVMHAQKAALERLYEYTEHCLVQQQDALAIGGQGIGGGRLLLGVRQLGGDRLEGDTELRQRRAGLGQRRRPLGCQAAHLLGDFFDQR